MDFYAVLDNIEDRETYVTARGEESVRSADDPLNKKR